MTMKVFDLFFCFEIVSEFIKLVSERAFKQVKNAFAPDISKILRDKSWIP